MARYNNILLDRVIKTNSRFEQFAVFHYGHFRGSIRSAIFRIASPEFFEPRLEPMK